MSSEIVQSNGSYKPISDKKVQEIALGIMNNRYFTSRHIHSSDLHLLSSIFMPLMFMSQEAINKMEEENISLIFEDLSAAGPRGINGYPIFFSMQTLNGNDSKRVFEVYTRLTKAVEETLNSSSNEEEKDNGMGE